MPKAISAGIRQSILAQYEAGVGISRLSAQFEVSRGSIHTLVQRHKSSGGLGVKPLYGHCGKQRPNGQTLVFRAVRCLKTWHPAWGANKIHAEIKRSRPGWTLPSIRTFYRWCRWLQPLAQKSKLPEASRRWAKQLHEGWQIDAKEEMLTADGARQCWLNIVDEHSGTVIDPPVFPPQENLRSTPPGRPGGIDHHF